MTDTNQDNDMGTAAGKANQLWADFVPVIAFVLSYNVIRRVDFGTPLLSKDNAIFWATGILMVLLLASMVWQWITAKKVSPMLLISGGIVGGFGLVGIILQEKAFIYIKPTIQQLFLAGIIFVPLFFGKNLWKTLFKGVFDLPDFAWRNLAIAWGIFFVLMALWNEFLWRRYAPGFESPLVLAGIPIAPAGAYDFLGMTFGSKDAEDIWANWKLANMPITLLYGLALTPYTLKHLREPDEAEAGEAA